ncbi:MAG: hypothetical protein SYR96_21420 [Actinomycetota bacterium]|nr:hypothetical protein [Actinomycetota bacterium]
MVLTALARWAAKRPHVFLAVAPRATQVRLALEAELSRTGAVVAASPADADVLLVAGSPGDELAGAIDEVWRQMPGPRARVQVLEPRAAAGVLGQAVGELPLGRAEAERADEWPEDSPSGPAGQEHGSHEEHGGHDSGMPMPGGLMMADRGPDRDGLRLDVLRVPWGPMLPDWPAGLVVDLLLQGDVVQQVSLRVLPAAAGAPTPFWPDAGEDDSRRTAASHLDSLGRLLAVAGWSAMAGRVRRLRDAVLTGTPADRARRELAAVDRRMRRSVTLRWATDGTGVLSAEAAERLGVSGPAGRAVAEGGDVTARWQRWLTEADRLLTGDTLDMLGARGAPRGSRPASAALLAAAEELMVGLDVAAARLVLASLDPDPDELVAAPGPAEAGADALDAYLAVRGGDLGAPSVDQQREAGS